jgi:hypothetical protein
MNSPRRPQFLLLALVSVVLMLNPVTAHAEWGNGCRYELPRHCYAQARWKMSGSGEGGGEEVKGLLSEINTTVMLVPGWEHGYFVTNEQWASFHPSEYWVEDGQIAGYDYHTEEGHEVNDDSLHWFFAWFGIGGFQKYVAPWTYAGWTWVSYGLADPDDNTEWCFKIGEPWIGCTTAGMYGFPKYANEVTVGAETADEAQPETSAKDRTTVQHLNGDWYDWNTATWQTESHEHANESAWLCVTAYGDVAGDINFATPNDLCGYE